MSSNSSSRICVAALLSTLLLPAAQAEDGRGAAERFPEGSIASVDAAEQALRELATERAAAQARYAAEERACHSEFFMTACMDKARERRRQAVLPLEALEVEANRYLRQHRAAERDRALAERRAEAEQREREAVAADARAPKEMRPPPADLPAPLPEVERSARPGPTPEQQREQARRDAENEAAYARKVQAARERQQAVARNKAEKERRRAQPAEGASAR